MNTRETRRKLPMVAVQLEQFEVRVVPATVGGAASSIRAAVVDRVAAGAMPSSGLGSESPAAQRPVGFAAEAASRSIQAPFRGSVLAQNRGVRPFGLDGNARPFAPFLGRGATSGPVFQGLGPRAQLARLQAQAARVRPPAPTPPAPANQDTPVNPPTDANAQAEPMASLGQHLNEIYREFRRFRDGGAQGDFRSGLAGLIQVEGDAVALNARGTDVNALADGLRALGARVDGVDAPTGTVVALTPIDALPSVATLPGLIGATPVYRPATF